MAKSSPRFGDPPCYPVGLTPLDHPSANGFVERFHRTAFDEFFRLAFRKKLYLTVEELQKDLDVWLRYYNEERPHQGYRNMGRRAAETIEEGKKRAPKKDPRKEEKKVA